jgi:REP element-mobilizing transposase RayT
MKTKRSRKPQQQAFEFFKKRIVKTFGGQLLERKRKSKRPLSTKSAIHLVIKSEKAKGNLSFVNHQSAIVKAISTISKKWNITVYDNAVNFNHVHFVIRINSESDYRSWIRVLTAEIVRLIAAKTGTNIYQFFTLRPWTRIVNWGPDYKNVMEYLILNKMEVVGLRPPRKSKSDPYKMKNHPT